MKLFIDLTRNFRNLANKDFELDSTHNILNPNQNNSPISIQILVSKITTNIKLISTQNSPLHHSPNSIPTNPNHKSNKNNKSFTIYQFGQRLFRPNSPSLTTITKYSC